MGYKIGADTYAHNNIYKEGWIENNYGQRKIHMEFALPDNGTDENTGLLILIPGYGEMADPAVFDNMMNGFPDLYNLIVLQCDYFGSKYMDGRMPADLQKMVEHPDFLKGEFVWKKSSMETEEEFNDMGLMQALDIVNASLSCIYYLKQEDMAVNTNKIILFGSCHGGYLAHLANIICPGLFKGMIDISSELKPYYRNGNRRTLDFSGRNFKAVMPVEMFLSRHPELQYDRQLYDLRDLYGQADNQCKIIALHGEADKSVDFRDKEEFIRQLGENASFMLISRSEVDGILCKNVGHGLGMDFFVLFEMLMPLMDQLLRGKDSHIHLQENVIIGKQKKLLEITYKKGFPEILFYCKGNNSESSESHMMSPAEKLMFLNKNL